MLVTLRRVGLEALMFLGWCVENVSVLGGMQVSCVEGFTRKFG